MQSVELRYTSLGRCCRPKGQSKIKRSNDQSKSESSSLSDRLRPPCRIVRCCMSAACCRGAPGAAASSKIAPAAASRAASTSAAGHGGSVQQ